MSLRVNDAPVGAGSVTEMQRTAAQKVLIIACGMIAREILAVKAANRLDHLELTCLPAEFHFHPDRIAPGIDAAITKAKAEGWQNIFVGYADCGTGGMLDTVCQKHGVARIDGPHCFAFYQGLENFERHADEDVTTFYFTDFLCRQFEAFFVKPLGLDRHPGLAKDLFANYERVVYLAQTDDPALEAVAIDAAKMLGLAYEKRPTGYGDLTPALLSAATTEPRA